MPNNQALQVFYGTIPLILIIAGVWLREQMLLKDILERLRALAQGQAEIREILTVIRERLAVLETRAGIIFHAS